MIATSSEQAGPGLMSPGLPTPGQIRAHLERVLASATFSRAPRMQRFLTFLVEETLAGREAQLKEFTIATCVFGKSDDFEPGTSAVVRVEAGRLRRLLAQYDLEQGQEDLIELQVPKGAYLPTFRWRNAVDTATAPVPIAEVAPTWLSQERRFVTALSCALSDESAAYALEGATLGVLEQLHEACARICLARGGEVDARAGDRLIVYFGWPVAQEDAPIQALNTALEMLAEAQRLAAGQPVALRIGVATSAVITRGGLGAEAGLRPAVIGEAPALATRMQQRAPANAVLVAESTRRLTGASFHFLPAGELTPPPAAGLTWRLLGSRPVSTRFRARRHDGVAAQIVGRREERALVASRWRLSQAGEGQAVLVIGEAGMGKSRVAEAALDEIGSNALRLRVQCSPHHTNSALFPLVELLRGKLARWRADGDARPPLQRLLRRLGFNDPWDSALLGRLVSGGDGDIEDQLSASQRKEMTLKLLIRMGLALAQRRPVAILIEDVHWADPTTLELLQDVIEASASTPMLVLMTSRPEGAPGLLRSTNLTAVRLARLPREEANTLVQQLTIGTELPADARALILDRGEGIPLFLEELTRFVLSEDYAESAAMAVPESLSDLLAAQLDRLGPTRLVAQTASVIGRVFSRRMLALCAGRTEPELDASLDQLVAAGVLVRDRMDGDRTFAFRHALLRDAAYRSLLDPRRRDMHLKIAGVLLDTFPELVAERPEVVAHHLLEGGRSTDSVPFWSDAGRLAAARHALAEATANLRMALVALRASPEQDCREHELGLLLELGLTIRSAQGYVGEDLGEIYTRAQSLAEELDRPIRQLEVVYCLWTYEAGRGRWPRAQELAREFDARAQRLPPDEQIKLEALRLRGASDAFTGRFASARAHHERAVALYDPDRHGPRFGFDPGVVAAAYLSWTVWHLGDIEAARRFAAQALTGAQAKGHPPTLALVFAWIIFHALCDEDLSSVEHYNAQLQALCTERECRYWRPLGAGCAEWAGFSRDGDPRHIDRIVECSSLFEERYLTSVLLILGARMCLRSGDAQRGLELIAKARKFIQEHDERVWEAEALRVAAELLHQARPAAIDAAQALLHRSLEVARRQDAVMLEKRSRRTLEELTEEASRLPIARRA
ncbi:AAA family ATPase [Caulobacter rhizosphaerae]|uniref:AAA family ATPase n=1 Tax=Caulobacter rhizosphaerae TaxID=2010972 RepID=UPI0013D1D50F|nr:AAA family ATPase [Caulobacter rhizosphaerae]